MGKPYDGAKEIVQLHLNLKVHGRDLFGIWLAL